MFMLVSVVHPERKHSPKTGHHLWKLPDSVWKSDDPSQTNIHLRAVRDDSDPKMVGIILDLVMRISELALRSGASASEATAMALRILEAHRVTAHFDITNTQVAVSRPGNPGEYPITAIRTVRSLGFDYARLSHLEQLVARLCTHQIDPEEARIEFDSMAIEPHQYRWWVIVVATGIMSAAIAVLFGGNALEAGLATVAAAVMMVVLRKLNRLVLPKLFSNALAVAISTALAVLMMWLVPAEQAPSASIVVGATIVYMLAGLNLVSAVKDGLDGYYITSTARIYEAFVSTAGIVLGVIGVLYLFVAFGVPLSLNPTVSSDNSPITSLILAYIVAFTFAVTCYTAPRAVLICGGLGVLCQVVSMLSLAWVDSAMLAAGLGAAAVAFVSTVGAPRWKIPVVALVSSGVISQVPGSLIYRGIYTIVQQQVTPHATDLPSGQLMQALLIGIALATGVSLGSLLGRPFAMPDDRAGRVALVRSWRRGATHRMRDRT